MSLNEMRNACKPTATPPSDEVKEALKQAALSMAALQERTAEAVETLKAELSKTHAEADARTKAVVRLCAQWEAALSDRVKEARDVLEEMTDIRDSLQWKRRTLMMMVLAGFLGGMTLLILSLSLPGVNSLMYRLILMLGRPGL